MEIKEMTLQDVEQRMSEIRTALDAPDADLNALEAEIAQLEARRDVLLSAVERRNSMAARIAAGTVGTPVRNLAPLAETPTEERFDASSKEYKTAWLKNLAVRDGKKFLGELTEVEQRAYTMTTANSGSIVPTDVANRIVELVRSDSPILGDASITSFVRGFGVPRHTEITSGDAKSVAEGAANDDEEDAFDLLPLSGVEIKKHVVITRKMQFQSLDAFETWLTTHLANRIRVAKENVILARLDGTAPDGGTVVANAGIQKANVLTGQTYDDATIRNLFSMLDVGGEKVVYANNATIWNHLAGIEDGQHCKLFVPNSMVDPITQGRIYGAAVKVDANLPDNVVYVIVKGQVLANEFDDLEIFSSIEPKTVNTIETAYSLFDAGLENPKGAVKATFTPGTTSAPSGSQDAGTTKT